MGLSSEIIVLRRSHAKNMLQTPKKQSIPGIQNSPNSSVPPGLGPGRLDIRSAILELAGPSKARRLIITQSQQLRENRWQGEFIACKNHPEKRCNRIDYVFRRSRRCNICRIMKAPSYKRHRHKYNNSEHRRWKRRSQRHYLKIQQEKI